MSAGIRLSFGALTVATDLALLEDKIKVKNRLFEIVKGSVEPVVAGDCDTVNSFLDVVLAASPHVDEDSIDFQQINNCLAYGIINEQEESSGYTPLIYGAYNCLPMVVEHLLSRGASAKTKENTGFNAFSLASYCLYRCIKLQIKNAKKPLTATFTAEMQQQKNHFYAIKRAKYQLILNLLDSHTEDRKFPNFIK